MNPLKHLLIFLTIISLLTSTVSAQYQANISVKLINQIVGGQEWGFVNRTMNQSTSLTFNGLGITYYDISLTHDSITFDITDNGEYIKSVSLTTLLPPECLRGNCTEDPNVASSNSVMLQLSSIIPISSTGLVSRNITKTLLSPSNDSIITLNYSNADFSLQEIIEDIPAVFDVTVLSPNTSMNRTGTRYNFTPLQILVYKITPNISDTTLLNKRYAITGTFKDANKASGIIGKSENITVVSNEYYLMMRYDLNKDNIINKNEAATAALDYFRTNTLSLKDVVAIVTKYFGGGHIL